jgi:hypothetical protein
MGIMAKEAGGSRQERELIPMDLHRGVCVQVIDLGSHVDTKWDKINRRVRLTFELADVRDDFDVDGEVKNLPRLIGKEYNLSLHEKATLRKDLQSWRKKQFTADELKGFDISNLVGVPCMVNVEHYTGHDGKTRAGIGGIIGLGTGMQAPAPEGETYYYSIDDHGQQFPEAMPDFIKTKIMASVEMGGAQQVAPAPMQAPAPVPVPQVQAIPGLGASVSEPIVSGGEEYSVEETPF